MIQSGIKIDVSLTLRSRKSYSILLAKRFLNMVQNFVEVSFREVSWRCCHVLHLMINADPSSRTSVRQRRIEERSLFNLFQEVYTGTSDNIKPIIDIKHSSVHRAFKPS